MGYLSIFIESHLVSIDIACTTKIMDPLFCSITMAQKHGSKVLILMDPQGWVTPNNQIISHVYGNSLHHINVSTTFLVTPLSIHQQVMGFQPEPPCHLHHFQ